MGNGLSLYDLFCSYVSFLMAIIGCQMFLGYLAKTYASDCIEANDLLDKEGKIIFNPLKYFDLLGTIVLPLLMLVFQAPILFGWSKSPWLNMPKVVRHYGWNLAILLASGGVFFHFFVAFFASVLHSSVSSKGINFFLEYLIVLNVFFAIVKLCPVLPCDGLRILSYVGLKFGNDTIMYFYWRLAPYGILILIVIGMTPLKQIIYVPVSAVLNFLL